jgi:hypothetical protein
MKTVRIGSLIGFAFLLTTCSPVDKQQKSLFQISRKAQEMRMYAQKKGYSTQYCFMLDMSLHSGLNRFFVYDLKKNAVLLSGLVAHGSCDEFYIKSARFSNMPGGGCTSLGLYKIGYAYYGQYGKSYKLYGLQNSNSNAFSRAVVLHAYTCVPDTEIYPKLLCNSAGCPMVSYAFLNKLSYIIENSGKPILLTIYN